MSKTLDEQFAEELKKQNLTPDEVGYVSLFSGLITDGFQGEMPTIPELELTVTSKVKVREIVKFAKDLDIELLPTQRKLLFQTEQNVRRIDRVIARLRRKKKV